jgi:DAK2 domain fusion protein YloV
VTKSIPAPSLLVASAAAALKQRIEEVNRLNVFPVPDGDTGTNMSLTMDTVVAEVSALGSQAGLADVCHAVTHGSLMGARGNSGVILSQILRGVCEGTDVSTTASAESLAAALERSTEVAFQAVRKPVEGTMLTVIKDTAAGARAAADAGLEFAAALEATRAAAFASVERTPELLPVLKENGVVDAGGFGLAILVDGFVAAALGGELAVASVNQVLGEVHIELADDWDDDEYLYCTEFLLFGDTIDRDAVHDFVSDIGGSELVVGDNGSFKVHVHTNDPGAVLAHVTALGEVAEVHVNNMRRQKVVRDETIQSHPDTTPRKPIGFVAVAAGAGLEQILRSLGADVIVSGGQTMNPSTADLVAAVSQVNADKVVILPNNKNILMAAQAAVSVADRPTAVVPTRSVPQGFAALLAFDGSDDLEALVAEMTEAASAVRTGEVTTAVKDAKGKVGDIKSGQVIGIIDDEDIEAVGDDVAEVANSLAERFIEDGAETLTLLAGADYGDEAVEALAERIAAAHPMVEVETHRGEQPLYPVIMSAE